MPRDLLLGRCHPGSLDEVDLTVTAGHAALVSAWPLAAGWLVVHPRFGTPHVAIVISGVLAIAYLWISSFEKLAAQFILGLWPFFALAVVGQMRLRRTQPALQRPFRTPGYPVIPLVFILAAGTLLTVSMLELPLISAVNVGISLLGIPVYLLWQRRA